MAGLKMAGYRSHFCFSLRLIVSLFNASKCDSTVSMIVLTETDFVLSVHIKTIIFFVVNKMHELCVSVNMFRKQ